MNGLTKAIKSAGTATNLATMLGIKPMSVSRWKNRYAQVAENLDGDSEINTSSPMLGVRDAEFRQLGKPQPAVSDRVFIKTVGGQIINQLFVVSNVEPDSHGGSRLVLNVAKTR